MKTENRIISKWALNFPQHFHWAHWKGEDNVALFHEGSGDAILLSPLGEYLLKRLGKSPLSSTELISEAGRFFDLEQDSELANSVKSTLRSFRDMGLIVSIHQ